MDPDLPLIEAIRSGDDAALDELINRHREPLFHFVFRYLRDKTAAGDVVQETFVRAYFKAPVFQPRAMVKTWLYAIALNLCRDQLRKVAKRRNDFPLDAPRSGTSHPDELQDSQPPPSEQSGQRERFAVLQRAIDQLPETLREALILFSVEGRSQKEVAEVLKTTPKTIELRVYHAKKKLRESLGTLLDDSPLKKTD